MNIRNILTLLFIVALFSQCVDEIELDIDTDQTSLTIDGQITDSLRVHTIKVSNSAIIGVGRDNILTPITGATVNVFDDEGGVFSFTEAEDGNYEALFQGIAGRSYRVEIDLPDGKKIHSIPSVLRAAPPIGQARGEVLEFAAVNASGSLTSNFGVQLSMNLDVSDEEELPYLRWQVEGEYEFKENYPMALSTKNCYIKNRLGLNLIKIFDTNILANGILRDEPIITTEFDYRFSRMYCFHISQYSMDKREFDYWSQVSDIINIDGNFFDPPPGTVIGNVFNPDDPKEQILGYFSVAGVSSQRHFENGEGMGYFIEEKCSSFSFRPQFSECRECTEIFNSSAVKPDYWIQ